MEIESREVYLGAFGSRESYERYAAVLLCWARQQPIPDALDVRCTVQRLTELYLAYARTYYVKRGRPTSQIDRIRAAARTVNSLYGNCPVEEFTPPMLEHVRDLLIAKKRARTYINALIRCIVRMFRWGVPSNC